MNQYQLLKDADCDAGQGYLFSKGLPADEFEKLLIKEQSKHTALFNGKKVITYQSEEPAEEPSEHMIEEAEEVEA